LEIIETYLFCTKRYEDVGFMKHNEVGEANVKQQYKQWNINTKTIKNSWCRTKVASLVHRRVKPYNIPQ